MPSFKKLTFAPLFLITFTFFLFLLSSIFKSYDFIFSLSVETLIQLTAVCILLSLSCYLFVIFAALCSDWKMILPVAILASLIPLFFLDISLAIVFFIGILISLFLTHLNLQTSLKSYLTFSPNAIFGPQIRHLSGFLILSICIVYFLSANKIVAQKGFQIPDSLIDASLSLSPLESNQEVETTSKQQLLIPNEQLNLLKQNPELLKQTGLDPKILDNLSNSLNKASSPKDLTQSLIKQAVKDQFQNLIKPYTSFIPPVLALLLFFTLQGLTSLINLLIYPLLWVTFYILEKTGFVTFTIEQRQVKKMVV